jgi:1-acyl-sn-glycerol-3-phosphate acyltransferase
MRHLRASSRVLGLVLWTALVFAIFLPLRVLCFAFRPLVRRMQQRTFRIWALGTAAIVGMRIRRRGAPPHPPFVLVSNHLSYMDIVLLATQLDAFFVAKSEVANWPVIGWLARSLNTIFVERGNREDASRVVELMSQLLYAGHGVVFFPEGTSSDGSDLLHFKSSLFDAPIRMGCPVYATALAYLAPPGWPPAGTSICWWGEMTFPDHLYRLLQMPWFEAQVIFGEGVEAQPDRRAFADASRDAVRKGFVPAPAQRSGG